MKLRSKIAPPPRSSQSTSSSTSSLRRYKQSSAISIRRRPAYNAKKGTKPRPHTDNGYSPSRDRNNKQQVSPWKQSTSSLPRQQQQSYNKRKAHSAAPSYSPSRTDLMRPKPSPSSPTHSSPTHTSPTKPPLERRSLPAPVIKHPYFTPVQPSSSTTTLPINNKRITTSIPTSTTTTLSPTAAAHKAPPNMAQIQEKLLRKKHSLQQQRQQPPVNTSSNSSPTKKMTTQGIKSNSHNSDRKTSDKSSNKSKSNNSQHTSSASIKASSKLKGERPLEDYTAEEATLLLANNEKRLQLLMKRVLNVNKIRHPAHPPHPTSTHTTTTHMAAHHSTVAATSSSHSNKGQNYDEYEDDPDHEEEDDGLSDLVQHSMTIDNLKVHTTATATITTATAEAAVSSDKQATNREEDEDTYSEVEYEDDPDHNYDPLASTTALPALSLPQEPSLSKSSTSSALHAPSSSSILEFPILQQRLLTESDLPKLPDNVNFNDFFVIDSHSHPSGEGESVGDRSGEAQETDYSPISTTSQPAPDSGVKGTDTSTGATASVFLTSATTGEEEGEEDAYDDDDYEPAVIESASNTHAPSQKIALTTPTAIATTTPATVVSHIDKSPSVHVLSFSTSVASLKQSPDSMAHNQQPIPVTPVNSNSVKAIESINHEQKQEDEEEAYDDDYEEHFDEHPPVTTAITTQPSSSSSTTGGLNKQTSGSIKAVTPSTKPALLPLASPRSGKAVPGYLSPRTSLSPRVSTKTASLAHTSSSSSVTTGSGKKPYEKLSKPVSSSSSFLPTIDPSSRESTHTLPKRSLFEHSKHPSDKHHTAVSPSNNGSPPATNDDEEEGHNYEDEFESADDTLLPMVHLSSPRLASTKNTSTTKLHLPTPQTPSSTSSSPRTLSSKGSSIVPVNKPMVSGRKGERDDYFPSLSSKTAGPGAPGAATSSVKGGGKRGAARLRDKVGAGGGITYGEY